MVDRKSLRIRKIHKCKYLQVSEDSACSHTLAEPYVVVQQPVMNLCFDEVWVDQGEVVEVVGVANTVRIPPVA